MTTSYTVEITKTTPQQISAFVTNGDGIRYGVTLSKSLCACSCPDAMYRSRTCKHSRMVVEHLETLRNEAYRVEREAQKSAEEALGAWSKASCWVTMNSPAILVPAAPRAESEAAA
jgi:hypothetical protein